jgi:hypothetical protein
VSVRGSVSGGGGEREKERMRNGKEIFFGKL